MKLDKKRKRLVRFAYKHLGKPYKFGAKLYQAPKIFDCSSFIRYLYQRTGNDLPRMALAQASFGREIKPKIANLKVGDLLFFKGDWGHYNPEFPGGIGHVGIYVGGGQVISARYQKNKDGSDGGMVMEENVADWLLRKDFRVVKRILE